jgi:ERCC4-related helicase
MLAQLRTQTQVPMCRWFPDGKIIFVAPTRPLVEQQLQACFEIVGIPKNHTQELLGTSMAPELRERCWDTKRVFFCTPQVSDFNYATDLTLS